MTMSRLGFDNRVGRVPATYGGYTGAGRGDGYLVPVIPKTDFAFDGRTPTPTSNTVVDIPIATGIDTSSWVSGVLAVRLHAKNTWVSTGTLNVFVDNIVLVPEEPDVVFAASYTKSDGTAFGTPAGTVTFGNADAAPLLRLTSLSTLGPMVRVRVNWVNGSATSAGLSTFSIGIDLVGRPA